MENQIDDLFKFVNYKSTSSPKTTSPNKKVVKRRYVNRSPSAFVTSRKKKLEIPKMPELPDLRSTDEKKEELIEKIDTMISKSDTSTRSLRALKKLIVKFAESL